MRFIPAPPAYAGPGPPSVLLLQAGAARIYCALFSPVASSLFRSVPSYPGRPQASRAPCQTRSPRCSVPVIPACTSPSPRAPRQIDSDSFQALFARAMKFSVAKTELLLSDLEGEVFIICDGFSWRSLSCSRFCNCGAWFPVDFYTSFEIQLKMACSHL